MVAAGLLAAAVAAYFLGYEWYGRGLLSSGAHQTREMPLPWLRSLNRALYPVWKPLRERDARRDLRLLQRVARDFSGAWEAEGGRRVWLRLDEARLGEARSTSYPGLSCSGRWTASVLSRDEQVVELWDGGSRRLCLVMRLRKGGTLFLTHYLPPAGSGGGLNPAPDPGPTTAFRKVED